MSHVTAMVVTHNAERWIRQLASSIAAQTMPPDAVVVVDDRSTDATVRLLRETLGDRLRTYESTASTADIKSRIAQNFHQGLRACMGSDVVVIGDHDDIWHPERIARQVALLLGSDVAAMVASDGRLIDESGHPRGGTLRSVFPVPPSWETDSSSGRMRMILRSSLATGGASAVRPEAFADLTIPAGWLHDRWWSLVAAAREALIIDRGTVIDYRVSPQQQVGLDRASQHRSRVSRVAQGLSEHRLMTSRWQDLRQDLVPLATAQTAPELSGWRLLCNIL